jgi:hypothetical protein
VSEPSPTSTPPPGAPPLWGNHAGSGAYAPAGGAPSGGGEQLTPLSRRLLQAAALLSVLLLAVLANSFLHREEAPLQLNPVAAAAERVEKLGGGRMSLYILYSSPAVPQPIAASGGGAFNEETDRTRVSLSVTNPMTGESIRVVQISDGEVEYDGGSLVAKELPPGKEWVRTLKSDEDSEEDETPLNMEESLEMLDSSGAVKMVGHERINGKMTRRYRGEVKLGDLIDLLREKGKDVEADAYERIEGQAPTEITAEGWVDRRNMLRRMRVVMPMPGDPGEPPVTVDMRMDFFDYGAKPDIKVPDPDTVVDGPLDEPPTSASVS